MSSIFLPGLLVSLLPLARHSWTDKTRAYTTIALEHEPEHCDGTRCTRGVVFVGPRSLRPRRWTAIREGQKKRPARSPRRIQILPRRRAARGENSCVMRTHKSSTRSAWHVLSSPRGTRRRHGAHDRTPSGLDSVQRLLVVSGISMMQLHRHRGSTPPRDHCEIELYIVSAPAAANDPPAGLEQLLRRQRRALLIRVVDAAGRRERAGSRI